MISISSISFENLLTILPVGVVSKNAMGARRILASRLECRLMLARMVPKVMTMMERKVKRDWRPPNMP